MDLDGRQYKSAIGNKMRIFHILTMFWIAFLSCVWINTRFNDIERQLKHITELLLIYNRN